jgi:CRISPR-associated endonuclease Cas2
METISEKILDTLKDIGWMATNVFFTDYYTSYKNARRYIRAGGRPDRGGDALEEQRQQRNKFYSLLNRLQKQGFIEKKKDKNHGSFWRITRTGLGHLGYKKEKRFLSPLKNENNKKSSLKVVIFDIPEVKRKERNWLRATLVNFGFEKLQKSVWIGEGDLSNDFMDRLKTLNIISFIHIFEISKKGSIAR